MSERRSTATGDPLPPTTTVHVRSINKDDNEETKEQPTTTTTLRPPHSRPPSIQIQHQRNLSAAQAPHTAGSSVSPLHSSGSLPSSARSSLRGLFGRHGKKASVLPFTPSPLQPFDASANSSPATPRSAPGTQPTEQRTQAKPAAAPQPAAEQKEQEGSGPHQREHRSTASAAWLSQVRAGAVVELTAQDGGSAAVDVVSPFSAQTVEEESEDEVAEEEDDRDEEEGSRGGRRERGAGDELRDRGKSFSTVARTKAPTTLVVEAEDDREAPERKAKQERKYDDDNDSERTRKPSTDVQQQPHFEHKYDDNEDDKDDEEPTLARHISTSAATTDDATKDRFSSHTLPPPVSLSALSACLPPALLSLLDQLRSSTPFDPSEHEISTSDRHIVQLERLSVADVKEAERRREQQRLEERKAVLQEWKEREWRVWKEERRVERLLKFEHDKQKAAMRETEVSLWQRQGKQMDSEFRALDEHERRLVEQLYSNADITITPLSSPSVAPDLDSLVDPTRLSFAAFPTLHRRYHAHYRHAPRLLSLHVHALRSVKDKLPAGQYHIRVSLYDRLGGRPLAWTGSSKHGSSESSKQRRECGSASVMTREAVRHGGGWWKQEMLFGQPANRMLLACPADTDSLPSMVMLFEVLTASDTVGTQGTAAGAVVAWGAFPLSSFSCASTASVTPADASMSSSTTSSSASSTSTSSSTVSPSTSIALSPSSRPSALSPSTAPPGRRSSDTITPAPPPSAPVSSSPSVTCSLVSGHHRLPLLVGPYNPSIRTWHELHSRVANDLNVWLCNLYFHASDGGERVEQERDYCVELQLGKRVLPEDEEKTGQDEQYVLLPPEEDGEIGERKRKRNRPLHAQNGGNATAARSTAASLMSRRLAHMDLTHNALVQQVRSSDGVSAEDSSDPFAVWPDKDDDGWRWLDTGDLMDRGEGWQGGQPLHEARELAVSLRTRKRKRKLGTDDNSMHAASADYQLAVAPTPASSSPSYSLFSALKLRYVLGHLDTVYHVSHPLSWPFLFFALPLVLTLWARLFLHYFTQYVFLSTALSSSSSLSIDCSYLGCSVDYDDALSTGTFLQLCILGSITPLVLLLLLCPLPSLYRRLTRRSPPLLADTLLLCFAICLIVDPFLADNTGLYDADSVTTLLVVMMSLSFAIVAALVTYLYLICFHMDGAVLDTWQRHQPAAVVDALYCVPSDYCMAIEELTAVIAASRQWRGELGERRRVRVKESGDGQATYVSIVVVAVDDDREAEAEVYRQFVLLRDGHVYELFDTRDITQQTQLTATTTATANTTAAGGGDAVAPAAADAYLVRLLKGRGKVMPRSARQLWSIARNHFNLSRSRGSSHSRVIASRSTFMRNGTTARMSTMHRQARSGSIAGSFSGPTPVNRMGTFGQHV